MKNQFIKKQLTDACGVLLRIAVIALAIGIGSWDEVEPIMVRRLTGVALCFLVFVSMIDTERIYTLEDKLEEKGPRPGPMKPDSYMGAGGNKY